MQKRAKRCFYAMAILAYACMLFLGVVLFSDFETLRPLRAIAMRSLDPLHVSGKQALDEKNFVGLIDVEGPKDFLVRARGSIVFKRTFEGAKLFPGDVLYTQEGTSVKIEMPGSSEQVIIAENSIVVLDEFGSSDEMRLSFLSGSWEFIDTGKKERGRSIASPPRRLKPSYVGEDEESSSEDPPPEPRLPGVAPQVLGQVQKQPKFFFQDDQALMQMYEDMEYATKVKNLIDALEGVEEVPPELVPEKKRVPAKLIARKAPQRRQRVSLDDLFMRETIYIRNVMRKKMGRSPASDITLSIALHQASTGEGGYRFNKAMELALDAYLSKYLIQGRCQLAYELFANASTALTKIQSDAQGLTKWKRRWKNALDKDECR